MSDDVKRRALGAVLSNAIFRWETFVTLMITLVLFFAVPTLPSLPFFQAWMWLVIGAIAEGGLILSHLTDPNAAQEAVNREFSNKYDVRSIRNVVSRQRLNDALEYRRNMQELVKRHQGAMRLSLQQTVDDIDDWIAQMHSLALHIDAFENNELVERDRKLVPQQLEKARIRLERESAPEVRAELENQIRVLEMQVANLEANENSIKRAEIQLESTLSSLGTVYAQMSLLGTKEIDSSRAQRLRLEIQDEVAALQDTIEAMDEVQNQRLRLQ